MAGGWVGAGSGRCNTHQWVSVTKPRILTRDHGICYLCGEPGADQVDHVIPVHLGGTEHDANLAAVHDDPCHRRKTAREGNAAKPRMHRAPGPHPGLT